jgi:DNA transformation protein and related proteins
LGQSRQYGATGTIGQGGESRVEFGSSGFLGLIFNHMVKYHFDFPLVKIKTSPMTMSPEFRDYVVDMLRSLGPVTARPMFGGGGLYLDGLMFGLVFDDVLFLKADDGNKGEFEGRGMAPIAYEREGRDQLVEMSYWEAPPELMDDADEMCAWAGRAWQAARRASARKKTRASVRKKARKAKPKPKRKTRARR